MGKSSHTGMNTGLRILAFILFSLMLSAAICHAAPEFNTEKYAQRMLHLLALTTLPLRICLLGDIPRHKELQRRLRGKKVGGRPVHAQIIDTDSIILTCDVLHMTKQSQFKFHHGFPRPQLLTISDTTPCHSIVCSLQNHPRIDINAASHVGIHFSSELYFQFRSE